MHSMLHTKTADQQNERKKIVQVHTNATDQSLKIRGGTKQTLHVRQKRCYKYRLYAGERFPKSLQGLRSPSIFASGILIVIQIPELNRTKDCEGTIQ